MIVRLIRDPKTGKVTTTRYRLTLPSSRKEFFVDVISNESNIERKLFNIRKTFYSVHGGICHDSRDFEAIINFLQHIYTKEGERS